MKTVVRLVTLSLFFILLRSLSAQTSTTDEVLKNMELGNMKYPSLQANIQRRSFSAAFSDLGDPFTGKIYILRSGNSPRRIKIDFDKPSKEYFLVEKNSFVHFYPGTKQGETRAFTNEGQAEGECIFLGLCQSAAVIRQDYEPKVIGQETIGTIKATVLELKSKDLKRSRGISVIKLWLDPTKWIPVQTRITQESGNYTEAKYSNISTAKFSESVFELKIPKDASVTTIK